MYRVDWTDTARAELRDIWYAASAADDELLIWAVADIAFRLERDPHNEGESRSQDARVVLSHPLAVLYTVPTDDTVIIHSIWRRG